MTIRGLSDLEDNLARALRDIEGVTEQGIKDVTFDLLGKAVELAPIDTGDLRGSGKAEFENDGMTGVVSFTAVYAHYQHEGLDFRHPQGGQAKYLQQPFEENSDRYIQHLKDSVRRETR